MADNVDQGNGAIRQEAQDGQGFDLQSESKFGKPAVLPAPGAERESYTKNPDALIEIKSVNRLGTVEIRKPRPQEWFRTHLHPGMLKEIFVIRKDSSGEFYAVAPRLAQELAAEIREAFVIAGINHEGALFVWPILKPKEDTNAQIFDSDLEHVSLSRSVWIRRRWDPGSRSYLVDEAASNKEPQWPESCILDEWLEKGFRGRFIDSVDHQLIRSLRGDL